MFKEFRARFIGKSSPVHFFWGSFDLAVTRFSGAEAPAHPGGVPNFPDWVAREAYSHAVSSAGQRPTPTQQLRARPHSLRYPHFETNQPFRTKLRQKECHETHNLSESDHHDHDGPGFRGDVPSCLFPISGNLKYY